MNVSYKCQVTTSAREGYQSPVVLRIPWIVWWSVEENGQKKEE